MSGARAAVAIAALAIAWSLAACEALVPSSAGDELRCADEGRVGPPACREGQYCRGGACTACLHGEICGDGVDDDCDGRVDQGCPDGGAPEASVPDPIGAPCTEACGGDLACVELEDLGVDDGPTVCSRPCCNSAECGPPGAGAVCWPVPHGGAICRRAADVGRPAPGSARSGAACSSGAECRSGVCDARSGTCSDVCCADASCSSAERPACVLRTDDALAPGVPAWSCGAAPGKSTFLQPCRSDAECASGFCAAFGVFQLCTRPCCSSDECGAISIPFVGSYQLACSYATRDGALVRGCVTSFKSASPAAVGRACTADADCRGDVCSVEASGAMCSDACCADVDCGDPQAFACRPVDADAGSVLRCAPR